MSNLEGFNANDWEPSGDFSPIPAGDYTVIVEKSEMMDTKDKTGKFLFLQLQVVDGEHKGRLVFDRLNVVNQSKEAVEIAKRQLADLCKAVGRLTPKDSSELHNTPLTARVSVDPPKGDYGPQNRVKLYRPANGAPPAPPTPTLSQAQPPPPAQRTAAPWMKK
jgi:hypothetical protein